MYYLVESWNQREMDVLYLQGDRVPNDQRWRVLGVYQTGAAAWAAYNVLLSADAFLRPSSAVEVAL